MTKKILICGLPGAGKTTLAREIVFYLKMIGRTAEWFNADTVRKEHNDWDFTEAGRLRQATRMRHLAKACGAEFAVCDFVAPTPALRTEFGADIVVWVDTIDTGRFEDTNRMFEDPAGYHFRVVEQNASTLGPEIANKILENKLPPEFNWQAPTVQMLGRWQPFHAGHKALFERLLEKTGQVCIMIRDCQGWANSNPFGLAEVRRNIRRALDTEHLGKYEIVVVPNIVHIGYGRDVGYTIAKEEFTDEIHNISGTKIRQSMGLE